MAKGKFPKELWTAIREHHKWHGDKNVKLIKWVYSPLDLEALVVQFTDSEGDDLSALFLCDLWKDGHYDVTELCSFVREYEDTMIENYEDGLYGGVVPNGQQTDE